MNAPEKIYNVSQSQFSIARHYGGIKFNDHYYHYDADTDTLTRDDVIKRDKAERKARAKAERKKWTDAQEELFI